MDMNMVESFFEHNPQVQKSFDDYVKYAKSKGKYKWVCTSNDGFKKDSKTDFGKVFDTQEEAYEDMRHHAINKLFWNTDWNDVREDCELDEKNGLETSSGSLDDYGDIVGENWGISYRLQFHPHKIQHWSYSGLYTYRIKKIDV